MNPAMNPQFLTKSYSHHAAQLKYEERRTYFDFEKLEYALSIHPQKFGNLFEPNPC
jgi:hypothetical protein